MPTPDLAKLFRDQLHAQAALHTDKKPAQQLNALRAAAPTFVRRVQEFQKQMAAEAARLERSTSEEDKERRAVLLTVVSQLEGGIAVHKELCDSLDKLLAAYSTSSWGKQTYSPEAKDAASKTFDRVSAFKLAVNENLTDDGAMTQDVRSSSAIGDNISRTNPIEVKDAALRIIASVEGPADKSDKEAVEKAGRRRAHLVANGVLVDAFIPPLKRSVVVLETELAKGVNIRRGAMREQIDETQLLLELTHARHLSLVNAGMSQLGERAGIDARDELRGLLPKSTSAKAKKEQAPQKPGLVVSGQAGAPSTAKETPPSAPTSAPSAAPKPEENA